MAHAQLGPVLCHLRQLVAPHDAEEQTDTHLLHAFAAHTDQAAFAALVRRHGPLVLGVCRRVLQQAQDAEDAFQATFLVLARKAASIRKGEALVSWLHGVAYRMAMSAKRNAARRRAHEGQAPAAPPRDPAWEAAWREVQTLLDEEIQRLPARYRAPFLLCCLDNRSRAEAAHELGLKEGTVWSRLSGARKLLRERLARRGVTLSAVLALAALPRTARAAVPARLAERTVRAALLYGMGRAAGTLISTPVLTLVEGAAKTMLATKARLIPILLLALSLFAAGAGVLAQPGAESAPPAPRADQPAPATPAGPRQAAVVGDDRNEPVALGGLVLGPDGKPAPGATLCLTWNSFKSKADIPYMPKAFFGGPHAFFWSDEPPTHAELTVRATTGSDGRFHFTARRGELGQGAVLAALAAGRAPDWVELAAAPSNDITLRLAPDDMPIEGRVLDLEGQPVQGVTATVLRVEKWDDKNGPMLLGPNFYAMNGGKMMVALEAPPPDGSAPPVHLSAEVLGVPTRVTTGADGRFRLTGLGRDRLVRLRLAGPGIETAYASVRTRPAPAVLAKGERVHYATFDHVAGPCRPILGTVREKSTGRPLAGVTVGTGIGFGDGRGSTARATTDAQGRYRLDGVGKAQQRQYVMAGAVPYFGTIRVVEETAGLEPLTVDFELQRGVVMQGRLTDRATGHPVRGLVSYYALGDNPHVRDFKDVGLPQFIVDGRGEVGPDGSFTVVALPGPGLLCVWADDDRYPRAEIANWDGAPLKTVPIPVQPQMFHAIVPINPSEKESASRTCAIALEPGRTVTGTVVGPDDQPLTGVRVAGLTAVLPAAHYRTRLSEQPSSRTLLTSTFTASGLSPRQPRVLVLVHPEKGLGKVQQFRGDETGPVAVRLEPLGALAGRILDAEGQPWVGLTLTAHLSMSPADFRTLPYEALGRTGLFRPGKTELFTAAAVTDAEGRFRVAGLLPSLKYALQPQARGVGKKPDAKPPFAIPRGLTVEAGKTRDLGEIRAQTTPQKSAKEERDE
jgi:RNA polymerase sigma factor (sigma-70 family)